MYRPSQLENELILAFQKDSDIDGVISQIEAELEEKTNYTLK